MKELLSQLTTEAKRNLLKAWAAHEITAEDLHSVDPKFLPAIISGELPIYAVFDASTSQELAQTFFPCGIRYGGHKINEAEFTAISKLFHAIHPQYKQLRGKTITADFGTSKTPITND